MTLNWLKALTLTKIQGIFFLLLLSFSMTQPIYAQDVDMELVKKGKDLFKGNCAACHAPTKDMTGPALQGVTARWEEGCSTDFKGKSGKQWLYEWIKNYNTAIEAELPYATTIVNWAPANMIPFLTLSDEDIDAILYYADNSDAGKTPATAVASKTSTKVDKGSNIVNWVLGFLILALLIVAFALAKISEKLKAAATLKSGVVETDSKSFFKSSLFKTLITLTILIIVFYGLSSQAIALGRQQGYQPMQPIKYSHALHVGENKIDCKYCHTGATEGKNSNIPSPNMCMNCHKMIQEGPEYGRKEIAKIYSAIGYNPKKSAYFDLEKCTEENYTNVFKEFLAKDYDKDLTKVPQADLDAVIEMFNKPIEWVRIHNMPDHVYFNHAQHVDAGNVECETCHGDVGNMEVVEQHAPLSMGWCINCHRNTNIDLGNEYYDDFENLHEGATVEDIGGTDCQKCHY